MIHRQGQKHGNAEGLSRGPISDSMEVDRHPSAKEGGMQQSWASKNPLQRPVNSGLVDPLPDSGFMNPLPIE